MKWEKVTIHVWSPQKMTKFLTPSPTLHYAKKWTADLLSKKIESATTLPCGCHNYMVSKEKGFITTGSGFPFPNIERQMWPLKKTGSSWNLLLHKGQLHKISSILLRFFGVTRSKIFTAKFHNRNNRSVLSWFDRELWVN